MFRHFPFNGVTTTFSKRYGKMCCNYKTGYNFNLDVCESILKNANIENFIASNVDDYVEKAVLLSKNINELEKVRKQLFDGVLKTPLFNTKEFSKNFCNAIDDMHKQVIKNYK